MARPRKRPRAPLVILADIRRLMDVRQRQIDAMDILLDELKVAQDNLFGIPCPQPTRRALVTLDEMNDLVEQLRLSLGGGL